MTCSPTAFAILCISNFVDVPLQAMFDNLISIASQVVLAVLFPDVVCPQTHGWQATALEISSTICRQMQRWRSTSARACTLAPLTVRSLHYFAHHAADASSSWCHVLEFW